MKHEIRARYPAPVEAVLRMFTDRSFHTRKLEALGISKYEVANERRDGSAWSIRIDRKVPINLPGFKGVESSVGHTESWDTARRTGTVQVETRGIPVAISCQARLVEEPQACTVIYTWTIESKLPLVGGALERAVVADMNRQSADETRVGVGLVEEYR